MNKPDPAQDAIRLARRKAARYRAKLRLSAEDFMEDQAERIRRRLAKVDHRLHKEYLRAGHECVDIHRAIGHDGPRCPSLDYYDGNDELMAQSEDDG